ncbi:MAG: methyltransferase [Epsilonproteobacteria bacterium]|nr:methyltransferase [Campylobacterota bacterium]
MTLYQPNNGYCYNSDTLFLYNFITKFNPKRRILDVGGGCGVLGLLVARDFDVDLTIIEYQQIMTTFIHKNLQQNNIQATVINNDFLKHDFTCRFDYIISNPPFYNSTKQTDNTIKQIARYDEYLPMEAFFTKVNNTLQENGEFIFCYEASRFDKIIQTLPKPLKVIDVQFVYPKPDKIANLVMIRAKRHARSAIRFHPPIFNFVGDEFSVQAKEVYQKADTKSIKQ